MPTATLKAYSGAYPSITNSIRAAVAYASDPLALIQTIVESGVHNARTWNFDGLPRNNYRFYLQVIDGSGNVTETLADFDVVPGIISGTLSRDDEQIQVGITPGVVPGATSWVFDGTETYAGSGIFKKDYRGWSIVVDECTGRDIMVQGVDYSWDSVSGTFQLLTPNDILASQQWYNIHFNTQNNTQGNSYPTVTDFSIRIITSTGNLTGDDFGNKVIVEPSSSYIEITLPDIATVPQGRKCLIESSNSASTVCAKFIPLVGQTINWLDGNVFLYPNESFSIYCFSRSGVKEWRICDEQGNFRTVGNAVASDNISMINCLAWDGSQVSNLTYARLYNMVLNLPVSQVVTYDNHELNTGTKSLYSLANGSGMFYIPDRRNFFERNSDITVPAGTYSPDTIISHKHKESIGSLPVPPFGQDIVDIPNIGEYKGIGTHKVDFTSDAMDFSGTGLGSSETQPKNYRINKYVLI